MTEDKVFGWRHQLNGHEFEQTPGDSEGQGSMVCCSPWGHRVKHNLAAEQQTPTQYSDPFSFFETFFYFITCLFIQYKFIEQMLFWSQKIIMNAIKSGRESNTTNMYCEVVKSWEERITPKMG